MATQKIADITLNKKNSTLTLQTEGKYVDANVSAGLSIQDSVCAMSGGTMTGHSNVAAVDSSCTISNSSNLSGISISAAHYVTTTALTCSTTTAGWASGTLATKEARTFNWNNDIYYINGVTLTAPTGNTPRTFSVTVPNGTSTKTITFSVASDGSVTIS